jgi:signal transduction histidine kinase
MKSMSPQDLRHLPLFNPLADDDLQQLGRQGEPVNLQTGDILFSEGDPPQGLFVVIEGELVIFKQVCGERVTLANVPPNSFVGEISLLTGLPHNASARAKMPTRLLKYGASVFAGMKDSPIIQLILATTVERLRDAEMQVQQHQRLSALGKMAAGLAHELNNPASANLRAATQLPQTLTTLQTQTLKLCAAKLNGEQLAFLGRLQADLIGRAADVDLDPLAQSDLEDTIMNWLDDAQIADSWRLAPMLASAGMNADELARIREQVGDDLLSDALNWLENAVTIARLSHTLKHCSTRLSELIKVVKAYTYMDQSADQSPVQDLDVHEGLENTLIVLRHRLKDIVINRLYNRELPRIIAFGCELNEVWTILLNNAADALAERSNGTICLRTGQENDYIVVEIADDGPGVPTDLQAHLFEPFFTTKYVGQGTGLSLSIARRIVVERHHGTINVVSRPGDTRVRVYLPLNRA